MIRRAVLFLVLFMAWLAQARAQQSVPPKTARADSVSALQKLNHERNAPPAVMKTAAEKKEEAGGEEVDLGTVSIQAVIEKPNVDIIPKRAEPNWEESHFLERSFGDELKRVPEDLLLIDEELERAEKLETLKKVNPPREEKKK